MVSPVPPAADRRIYTTAIDSAGNELGSAAYPSYSSIVEGAPTPISDQQLAPAASSALPNVPANATRAIIVTTGADCRIRFPTAAASTTPQVPTASVGWPVVQGSEFEIVGFNNITYARIIQSAATANVFIQYFA